MKWSANNFLIFTIISLEILYSGISNCESIIDVQNHIRELRKELFKNRDYDPMARPVLNYTHPVNVSIYLDINYIKKIDIQTNIMESEGWIRLSWIDENLKWKPSDYGDLEEIRVSVEEVFRPDITIINSVETDNVLKRTTHSDLILWYTGEIFWMPALTMKTLCDLDLTYWPFDQQTCVYRFASWTYNGNALDLQNVSDRIDLSSFADNPEWDIIDSSCEYKLHDYIDNAFYPEVIYSLDLQRKTTIYRFVIYLPVMSALFLNLMALFLDVRNKLRFHLSTLCFFTLLFIVLFLGNKLGFGSLGTPKVIKYIGQMIVLTSITILWFAFSLNFIKSTFEMPPVILRTIEPVQHFFVSKDIESVQLTNNDPESGTNTMNVNNKMAKSNISKSNLIIVQVVDKIWFALFLILMIMLHN